MNEDSTGAVRGCVEVAAMNNPATPTTGLNAVAQIEVEAVVVALTDPGDLQVALDALDAAGYQAEAQGDDLIRVWR